MRFSDKLNFLFSTRWCRPALICDEFELTYGQLYCRSEKISSWLAQQGCQAGDRIVLKLENSWQLAAAYLSCLIGAYCIVPINPELRTEDQAFIIDLVRPRVVIDDLNILTNLGSLEVDSPSFGCLDENTAAIFFTSGTTGRPKGVCHSLGSLIGNVISFNKMLGLDSEIRQYHVLPMTYMAGFLNALLSPWMAGGAVLLGPRFLPSNAIQFWMRPLRWKANSIWLTPSMAALLARISRSPKTAQQVGETFRYIFCGTAPLSESTRNIFSSVFGCPLQESYGMSEVLLVSAQTRDQAIKGAGVGCVLPGLSIRERDAQGVAEKELMIHTPWALKSYICEEGEVSPLLQDGSIPSGDLGVIIDGQLTITGRLKDLIIRGGLNVSPVSIEDVLSREPGVDEVSVVGIPHEFWGEIIVACLVARHGHSPSFLQTILEERSKQYLSEGMRPDKYIWLKKLPHTSSGKIEKHFLRKELHDSGLCSSSNKFL